jgi:hypothetical protein
MSPRATLPSCGRIRRASLLLLLLLAPAAFAYALGRRARRSLLVLNGWAGPVTDMNGFSHNGNFYRFDGKLAFGGGIQLSTRAGILLGLEGLYSKVDYQGFATDSVPPVLVASDEATLMSGFATARLAGGGGLISIYLAGAAGIVSWDLPDIGERTVDPALSLGIGVDLFAFRYVVVFGQYDQWWIYHEKDDDDVSNTANTNLLRFGLRFGIL